MADKRVASMHFGGPMGLAGLALLAGAAGIVIYDGARGDPGDVTPTSVTVKPDPQPQEPIGDGTDTPPDVGVDVPIVEPGTKPVTEPDTPDVSVTEPDKSTIVIPKPPTVKPQTGPETQPAMQTRAEATFIVRIKGAPEIDQAAKLFRKDRETAEKAFAKYQAQTPGMKGFKLVGASYSGELKLAYEFEPGVEPTRAEVRKVQKKIMAVKGVAYADPDYIAHPGKKD